MSARNVTGILKIAQRAREASRGVSSNADAHASYGLIADLAIALAREAIPQGALIDLSSPVKRIEGRTASGRKSSAQRPTFVYACGNDHRVDVPATCERTAYRSRATEWIPSQGYLVCPHCIEARS